jgi:glycosyltransferase involved in cell wall biosynthesis
MVSSPAIAPVVPLPKFSMILETENLESADRAGLIAALGSILAQDLSPWTAEEVILIDSGDVPEALQRLIAEEFPWIKVHSAPDSIGYYGAKMLGASLATGEVIVYCDSDCLYEPHWLRTLLQTFVGRPEVAIVAGETTTQGYGPYGTAMAITYIFPQYSGETAIVPTRQYYLNNVAFRRSVLLEAPMPTDLPLYRGNCVIHARSLGDRGHTIWRQPQARALHAPPNGLGHFVWRFLLIGHDYYWQAQLRSDGAAVRGKGAGSGGAVLADGQVLAKTGNLMIFRSRLRRMLAHEPRHLWFLPLSLPMVLVSAGLIAIGYWLTRLRLVNLLKGYADRFGA